jgi:hypothetical protein
VSNSIHKALTKPSSLSPANWPTVWIHQDGQLQHREKIFELLEDYIEKDLDKLDNEQIWEFYGRASLGKLQPQFFKDRPTRRILNSVDTSIDPNLGLVDSISF